jgi:uncharacterized phage infection (PIP) family protein YhgE
MSDRVQPESHIEQVRELMFGPQLRECGRRIEQLEALVSRSLEDTQKRFGEMRDFGSQELSGTVTASDKKLKALDLKASEELAQLRMRIEEIEERCNARLQSLEDRLNGFQDETRKRIEATHDRVSGSLQASIESTEKRFQALGTELQTQTGDLRRQAKRTDEKLESRVQSLSEEIESGAARLRGELAQAEKGMRDSVHAVENHLSSELRRVFNDVRYSKVSKDEISDILVEFGMRLKGMDASSAARVVSLEPPSRNE